MWDTLWLDGHIATMDPARGAWGALRDGALAVEAGRIAWLGPAAELPGGVERLARDVREMGGGWMTPGLIDCHTHLVFAGDRSDEWERRLAGATYEQIAREGGGIHATVRATRAASLEELRSGAESRAARLAAEGVTTIEVKSGYGLETAAELRMLTAARAISGTVAVDVRTTVLGAHALPPEFEGRRRAYVDLVCEELLPRAAAEGAHQVDAFLEGIAFDAGECERVLSAGAHLGLAGRLHADQLSDGGGAELAARLGARSADHLECASEGGVRALADAGLVAVLLPGSLYFLRDPHLPPVDALRARGVPIAIATDLNPGSSPVLSMLLALNLSCMLLGLRPEEALSGATRHAARVLGLDGDRGTLAAGLRADLAVWAVSHPRELAYWAGGSALREAVKDGVPRSAPELAAHAAELAASRPAAHAEGRS